MMFHSRGVKSVPLSKLPDEYQAYFGTLVPPAPTHVTPTVPTPIAPPTPPPAPVTIEPLKPMVIPPPRVTTTTSARDPDWEAYNIARKTKFVLRDKLVDRSQLTPLVGFVENPVRISDGATNIRGYMFELAEKKDGVPQPSAELSLRPNLWQRTGKRVLLRNYKLQGEPGILVRVYAVSAPDVEDGKSFETAFEPTFEQWKQLRYTSLR